MANPEVVSLSPDRSSAPMALRPASLAEYSELAKILADSDIVPRDFKGKPGNVLVALLMGAEVGLHPTQALQSIAVINGKPCIYGDAGLAIVMRSGLLEDIDETDDGQAATCRALRKGKPTPVVRSFSVADAQQAKVYERDAQGNGRWIALAERAVWKSYPKRMRQMRARWWALRDAFPDVLKGLHGREEVEDVGDELKVGADAAKRVGEDFESMRPRRASEAAPPPAEGQEADRGGTEHEGAQAPAGAGADRPVGDEPAAGAEAHEAAASNEPPQGGDEPPPGPQPEAAQASRAHEESPPPPPLPPPPAAAERQRFQIGKQSFDTAGITKEQMLATFKLVPKVDAKHGKDYTATHLLLKEFGVVSRTELTKDTAGKFIIRLNEILGDA